MDFFSFVLEDLTGWAYIILIFFSSIYFSFRLGFIQLRKLLPALRQAFCPEKNGNTKKFSSLEAASTALAGAMGTGNIAGVASAIALGGPGAVFWMVISAFFSMAVKYSEIFLSVRFRGKNGEGGPMYYMEKVKHGDLLAAWFAFSCVAASFGIGNLTQSNSASNAICEAFGVSKTASACLITFLFLITVWGGSKMIGRINSFVIPLASGIYLASALGVLFVCRKSLPGVFRLIWNEAFAFRSAAGGAVGFFTSQAVHYGISRGIFSNESGIGSSAIAHGNTNSKTPSAEALWGIVEVFLDTVVMCSLTALTLLASGVYQSGESGSLMTAAAFTPVLGKSAAIFIALSCLVFASASISGWYYYGGVCLSFLSSAKLLKRIYFFCFCAAIFAGCFWKSEFVFGLSDFLNMMMAIPNLTALICLRRFISSDPQ